MRALLVLSTAVAGLSVAGFAGADSVGTASFKAALNLRQEIPKPTHVTASARGTFRATVSRNVLTWTLTYSHLSGPVTATYLDYGNKTQTGAVLLPICTPCKSPTRGSRKVTSTELKDIVAGKTYVNVNTIRNPRGEIRGQVS
jgi:hypothetical protein